MAWWFFVWGSKTQKSSLGDGYFNCPHCQCRQPASLSQIETKEHVYFIPIGRGDASGPEVYRCKVCRHEYFNDGSYGFDFGPHRESENKDWKCFKCGGAVPYEQTDCPHCGFSFMGR